jgi:ABC-type multidrug transport system ATPase subunit
MKVCSHCGHSADESLATCPRCGNPLASAGASRDETLRFSGPPLAVRGEARRTIALDALFAHKSRLLIGRSPECDVCLAHPMVSRRHALLERASDGRLRLTDLDSVNGLSVNGVRLDSSAYVDDKAAVGIGPFLFTARGGQLYTIDNSRSLRLEARRLEKIVPIGGGMVRKLLDDISLAIEPGEFVGLLGPSGSGKSTLMDCLNGRGRATSGQVLANGADFYRFFDNFRQSLGYVPQKDIVHGQLSVQTALYYTARLRLPPDTSASELAGRIEEVIRLMDLGPHRETMVANLSGGQMKRVSLGAELLARPCLLFIDEATSGLDAGTEGRMMRLFRQLADEGRSLICITHNVDHVDRCHLALVLARGKLVFFGPPADAPGYFGVQRISDVYDRLAERDLGAWERQFVQSEFYKEFVTRRLESSPSDGDSGVARLAIQTPPGADSNHSAVVVKLDPNPAGSRPSRLPLWHQFHILTARYAELLWGDRRSLRLLAFQAPAVALILLVGFVNKPFDATLPRLRPLKEEEKHVLVVLKGIEQDLAAAPGERAAQAGQGESEIAFVIDALGQRKAIKIAQIRDWLVKLEQLSADSPQRAVLEAIRIEVVSGGAKLPVDLKQINDLQRLLRQSQLATKLLEADRDMPVVPERRMTDPRYTYMLLFMVVIIVLWFGCNNASKEIAKEQAIYTRERAVNLGILPYLASKFLLLSLLTILQAALLLVLVYGFLEGLHACSQSFQVPSPAYELGYAAQFGILALLSTTGVALGLLLSACVSTPDRANALLPYVLIPQIILGGGIMPVKGGLLYWLAVILSPVYWAYRAVRTGTTDLPDYTGYRMDYAELPWVACLALAVQGAVLLALTAWFLKAKDLRRG